MKLYQIDVRSTFFSGLIQEEVYIEQPPWFRSDTFPHHVFKLSKSFLDLLKLCYLFSKIKCIFSYMILHVYF